MKFRKAGGGVRKGGAWYEKTKEKTKERLENTTQHDLKWFNNN